MRTAGPLTRQPNVNKFARLVKILDRWVPADEPTGIIPIASQRGFKGFRVSGVTGGREWSVDLFGGNFYLVQIAGLEPVPLRLPLHVVNHLKAHLRTP